MSDTGISLRVGTSEPLILVVDDDRRVRELLEIAFGSQGYRVAVAADGEEALQRVAKEVPDLIVLDVRLPRRSGLDVCDRLRRAGDTATLPIIVVSAATDGEVRLQAFQRGADDFLVKPFSPRELLARVRRLLDRSQQLAAARARMANLEQELGRSRKDAGAARQTVEGERRRQELIERVTAADAMLDPERLARAILREARRETGASVAALFVRQESNGLLEPFRVHGDTFDRITDIRVSADSPLARFLAALGRPAEVALLANAPEWRDELGGFAGARLQVLAPIVGPDGLRGLVALDAVSVGEATRAKVEALSTLSGAAARPLASALEARRRAVALLDLAGVPAGDTNEVDAIRRASGLVSMAARAAGLPPSTILLVRLAVLAGPRCLEAAGWYALERAARCDETLLISNLQTLLQLAVRHDTEPDAPDAEHADELGDEDGDPWQIDRASILAWVTAGWRIADRLRQGAEPAEAVRGEPVGRPELHRAFERVDVDAAVVDAPLV